MPYGKDSKTGQTGNAPNQFAQVGSGGSLGGGQFEQGEGQSGSLQDQQGGTTTRRSVPLGDSDAGNAATLSGDDAQQEQEQRNQDAPGESAEDDAGSANT